MRIPRGADPNARARRHNIDITPVAAAQKAGQIKAADLIRRHGGTDKAGAMSHPN